MGKHDDMAHDDTADCAGERRQRSIFVGKFYTSFESVLEVEVQPFDKSPLYKLACDLLGGSQAIDKGYHDDQV